MITRTLLFEVAVASLVLFLLACAAVYSHRVGSSKRSNWQHLIKRLRSVDQGAIRFVAERSTDFRDKCTISEEDNTIEFAELWALIGGIEGLERLRQNCAVLIDLARYVQQWYPEAVVTAEQLRLSARELNWQIDRVQGAALTGQLKTAFPDYAQRAILVYYGMTQALLSLYEGAQLSEIAELRAAF